MKMSVAVTVNLECAHKDELGRVHGHSYLAEIWRPAGPDLVIFASQVKKITDLVDHTMLEDSVGDPNMEGVGVWLLQQIPEATRIVVRRPTLGFIVEVQR
jgi:6-pyruvoyl-tetrahydropterin synthase